MSQPIATVRASSWGDLFDCSYRWYWKNVMGMRLPYRGAAVVGTAIHKGSAVYDQARLNKQKPSVEEAAQVAADAINKPDDEDKQPPEFDEEMTKGEAVDFAVKLTTKYCTTLADDLEYSSVEVKCKGLDVQTDNGVIRLTGTTDRVRVFPNRTKGILDFKSGGKAVGTDGVADVYGHGVQLGVYTLMVEQETKQALEGPASIVGLQTNSKLRVGLGEVAQPKRPLVGTAKVPGLIEIAAGYMKSGIFPPNPKSVLCSKKWCPAYDVCIYHE
jgi:hypothetical protein